MLPDNYICEGQLNIEDCFNNKPDDWSKYMNEPKKDWSGNKNSVFKTLGASNHTDEERQENDFYATDPIAIDALIGGGVKLNNPILECACGNGLLSECLKKYGYDVQSQDLVYRGYGKGGVNFFTYSERWSGDILTNPPYKYAQEFVEHALDLVEEGKRVYMFLKLQFLEGKGRKRLFDRRELKTVYVSRSRILCAKNAEFQKMKEGGGSAVAYAWYEFEKGYNGDPVIKWIN